MKKEDLIHAVSYISLSEERQEELMHRLREQARHGNRKVGNGRGLGIAERRIAAVILGLAMAGGISMSAYALVNSQLKERMEEMAPDTLSELDAQVQSAEVEEDSFNRPYSDAEQKRMEMLYTEYMGGHFPQGELAQVDSEEAAAIFEQEDKICFLPMYSKFYLPLQREMTDEEILEVLDFMTKRDYALAAVTAQDAADSDSMNMEGMERTESAEAVITEEEAIDIAATRAAKLGLNLDGFELNHYFDEGSDEKDRYGGLARYGVNWSNIISHKYYYFYINAADGSILDENYNGSSKYQETAIQRNIQNGGISTEKAIALAGVRLEEAGLHSDAYDCNIRFVENYSSDFGGRSYYQVTWIDGENRKFYVFYLDSMEGTILEEHIN